MAGYSGTPLAKKLGLKEGFEIALIGAPDDYRELLEPLPGTIRFVKTPRAATHLVHLFVTKRKILENALGTYRKTLSPEAILWLSWPKKASKVATEVTEDTIRELALPLGFVDVKVCAVNDVWSGLKLVVRKELR